MKKSMIVIYLFMVFIGSGCSNYSKINPNKPMYISKKDRIGFLIEASDGINFIHKWPEIEKKYQFNWSPQNDAEIILRKSIQAKWINLRQENFNAEDLLTLFKKQNGKYVVNNINLYQVLINKLYLKAIVALRHESELLQHGEMFYVDKPSLVSLSALGLKRYYAISTYNYYLLDLANPSMYRIPSEHNTLLYNSIYSSYSEKSGFKEPRNMHNITEEELSPVRRSFIEMFTSATNSLGLAIKRY